MCYLHADEQLLIDRCDNTQNISISFSTLFDELMPKRQFHRASSEKRSFRHFPPLHFWSHSSRISFFFLLLLLPYFVIFVHYSLTFKSWNKSFKPDRAKIYARCIVPMCNDEYTLEHCFGGIALLFSFQAKSTDPQDKIKIARKSMRFSASFV